MYIYIYIYIYVNIHIHMHILNWYMCDFSLYVLQAN